MHYRILLLFCDVFPPPCLSAIAIKKHIVKHNVLCNMSNTGTLNTPDCLTLNVLKTTGLSDVKTLMTPQ